MPYAPGIQSEGGQYMFAGLRGAGQNAMAFLSHLNRQADQQKEEEKRVKDDARFADMLRRRMPDQFGQSDEQWSNLGARDKVAAGRAAIEGLGLETQKQQQALMQRTAAADQALEGFGRALAADQTVQNPGRSTSVWGTMPTTERPAYIDERLMTALQAYPQAMSAERAPALIRAIADIGALQRPVARSTFSPEEMGVAHDIPGVPGKKFVTTSANGGQVLDVSGTASGQWQKQFLPDGTDTGWAIGPDGTFRRLPGQKDIIDAAKFDTDGDGVLNAEEFGRAIIAQKLGGMYPGMPVSAKTAAGPSTRNGSPKEEFLRWRATQ